MTNTVSAPKHQIATCPMQSEEDFWRIHQLLIDTYQLTPLRFNWEIRRWEGKRFYDDNPIWPSPQLAGLVQLWETTDGILVGAVHPEGEGDAHLQVHPDYRAIEAEMMAWAEEHLTVPAANGNSQVELFVYEYDTFRQELLASRGYTKTSDGGVARRLKLAGHAVPEPTVALGYTLRTTNPSDLDDCQRIADLLNAAFNRDFHNALEYQNFTRLAPSFQRELDLVAVAPDGSFAAYVGIPYDEANRHGIFEPVCTHPDHRRRGLAKALMQEGLRRLHTFGAIAVTVETGDMIPANRLYDNIGFSEVCKGHVWQKTFD